MSAVDYKREMIDKAIGKKKVLLLPLDRYTNRHQE